MKPDWLQQAFAGLAVLFVVAVTIVGGLILALGEAPGGLAFAPTPTATVFRIPTLPPEDTPLPTVTSVTPTARPLPTGVPTPIVPPASPTAAPATIPPTSAPACQVRSGWVPYVVRPGDTLYQIGLRYGVSVDVLQQGGCLPGAALTAGQTIYVPPGQPVSPTQPRPSATGIPTATQLPPTPTSGATPTSTGSDGACTTPDAQITSPRIGAVLSGVVQFRGTASNPDFSFYKLELRQEDATSSGDFITFYTSQQPVVNGVLGQIDTRAFPNGEYWIRLLVVDSTSNFPEACSQLFIFSN